MAKKAAAESAEGAARMLQHWHEGVPDDRLAHLVKDATRAFLRSLQLRLGRHDVQLGHWTFLRILWEKDGLTQVELSAEAGVMAPTTAIALKGMEELGYVVRKQRPDNRKSIYVFLTPAGKRLKAKLVPLAEEVNALAVRSLPESHVSIVRHALLTMIENLANDEQLQG
ncbi:DNA-binding MarR family transcriptional regulator [Variovorax guangxiensis]|nr:DNA-binding MarR family transcriptional regulator [Variovorax guangxiensis]